MAKDEKLAGLNAEGVYDVMKRHNVKLVQQLARWNAFGQHIINTAFHRSEYDLDSWAGEATALIEDTEDIQS